MDQETYDAWVIEGNELCGSTNWDHRFNGAPVEIRDVNGAPRVIGKPAPGFTLEEWLASAFEKVRKRHGESSEAEIIEADGSSEREPGSAGGCEGDETDL